MSKVNMRYRLTDLAVRNIKNNVPLMASLMKHFNRGQRTIDNMLDSKDIRLTASEVVELIITGSGLYREQIIEEVVAVA